MKVGRVYQYHSLSICLLLYIYYIYIDIYIYIRCDIPTRGNGNPCAMYDHHLAENLNSLGNFVPKQLLSLRPISQMGLVPLEHHFSNNPSISQERFLLVVSGRHSQSRSPVRHDFGLTFLGHFFFGSPFIRPFFFPSHLSLAGKVVKSDLENHHPDEARHFMQYGYRTSRVGYAVMHCWTAAPLGVGLFWGVIRGIRVKR